MQNGMNRSLMLPSILLLMLLWTADASFTSWLWGASKEVEYTTVKVEDKELGEWENIVTTEELLISGSSQEESESTSTAEFGAVLGGIPIQSETYRRMSK